MDYGLKDKIALVVGGGGGSGRLTSVLLSQEGAKVVVADVNEGAAIETVNMIQSEGGEATAVKLDVLDEGDMIKAVNLCEEKYGGLHFGINIVGTSTDFADITQVPTENFDRMFNICVRSAYYGMKYQIPAIMRSGGGAVTTMGSNGGLVAEAQMGLYSACKHAVVGMTKSAAIDFAQKGVRVNCVCPGPMNSAGFLKKAEQEPEFAEKMLAKIPLKRMIDYKEIAGTFVFLCSSGASAITGEIFECSGGMLLRA
ncbi:4-formylbenzenesulfonate dehydrogenase TsaC1/TsaC2 [anaerobic digester metagenome]